VFADYFNLSRVACGRFLYEEGSPANQYYKKCLAEMRAEKDAGTEADTEDADGNYCFLCYTGHELLSCMSLSSYNLCFLIYLSTARCSSWRHLAANRNCSKEGSSSCRNVSLSTQPFIPTGYV